MRTALPLALSLLLAAGAHAADLPDRYDLRRGLRWVAKSHDPPLVVSTSDPAVLEGLVAMRRNTPGLKLEVVDRLEAPSDHCALDVRWVAPSWEFTGNEVCPGVWHSADWVPAPRPQPDWTPAPVPRIMGAAALGQLTGVAAGVGTTAAVCAGNRCGGDGGPLLLVGVASIAMGNTLGGLTGAALGGGLSDGLAATLGGMAVTAAGAATAARSEGDGWIGLGVGLFAFGPTIGSGLGPLAQRGIRAATRPRRRAPVVGRE